ncbi:PAS domain-containing sensor histidine kinase [Geomonas silvestris]|uniref:histidine kinase n=1 Tax=Geomonas silvestris TaxID=2740184 RepID=A0A6V8MKS2_9BACT|nr:ATP-binding protein [Geomonas silvestris]GFO60477.1 PAS domain-containing sensor histidine kinase [Geomonas silvestris]
MRGTFRLKLMASYLLLVLLLGAGLYAYLSITLESSLISGIRDHLKDQAQVAALMAAKEIKDPRRDAPQLTQAVAQVVRARVTVIGRDGQVLGDSQVKPADLPLLENHAGRPEVREALAAGSGSAVRYSATLHTDMLYLAVPFADHGVLRLALPLSEVEKTRHGLKQSLTVAFAVGVILSLLLSYLLSHLTSRTLRGLAATAGRIGRGEPGVRFPVQSADELGELAQVMNEMARRIETQMERISSEKNRLDAILSGMGEGVMVTDTEAVITLVNPAFGALFGSDASVKGRKLIEISRHPDLYAACREVLSDRQERHQEITLPGGRSTRVHWVPLVNSGELKGVVAVFHDISALKRVEKIRRDFVANVSHELRTPVTVIKGYAETLLSGALASDTERGRHFLTIIDNHASRLSGLIADLLALSELESGDNLLKLESVRLESSVRQSLQLLELKAEEKALVMRCEGMDRVGPVFADRKRLDQVLMNLLDNAIKYSKIGGTVTVSARPAGDLVRVEVRDTGIGIPEKDLPRLFERFYRVDEARSRERGGTGLGLSIVKHIVQAHGGSVEVSSTLGEGAAFSFTLPKGDRLG